MALVLCSDRQTAITCLPRVISAIRTNPKFWINDLKMILVSSTLTYAGGPMSDDRWFLWTTVIFQSCGHSVVVCSGSFKVFMSAIQFCVYAISTPSSPIKLSIPMKAYIWYVKAKNDRKYTTQKVLGPRHCSHIHFGLGRSDRIKTRTDFMIWVICGIGHWIKGRKKGVIVWSYYFDKHP